MDDKGKEEHEIDMTKPSADPDIAIAEAVPAASNEPPIPAGHSRFYCSKCRTVRVN
jgi:hypothetical protein